MFCWQNNSEQDTGVMRSRTVEDKYVKNVLLDTGCLRTLVNRNLVAEGFNHSLKGELLLCVVHMGTQCCIPWQRCPWQLKESQKRWRLLCQINCLWEYYWVWIRPNCLSYINPTGLWSRWTTKSHGNVKSCSMKTEGTEGWGETIRGGMWSGIDDATEDWPIIGSSQEGSLCRSYN